eukprot:scaffold131_cov206-Alexandrium_tamarense.AAC.10
MGRERQDAGGTSVTKCSLLNTRESVLLASLSPRHSVQRIQSSESFATASIADLLCHPSVNETTST